MSPKSLTSLPQPALRKTSAFLIALVPVGTAVGLAFFQLPVLILNEYLILIGFVLLAAFILVDLLAGQIEDGVWAGYPYLMATLTWLTIGVPPALWIIVVGKGLTAAARLRFNLGRSGVGPSSAVWSQAAARTSITGSALIMSAVIFHTLGGQLPFRDFYPAYIAPLGLALLAGFATTQLVGYLLLDNTGDYKRLWDSRQRFIPELILLFAPPTLSLVLFQTGPLIFSLLVGLITLQAIRYKEMTLAQESLVRRGQELSTLTSVGQTVSTANSVDTVLFNIYQQVSRLLPVTTFVIALYDDYRDVLDYPLVMEHDQRRQWPSRKPDEGTGISAYVIRHKTPLSFTSRETARLAQLGIDASRLTALSYLAVPLMTGSKIMGVMSVHSDKREHAFGPAETEILQTIAHQAALAIRNAVLYERSLAMAEKLSLINQSVQDVMFNLDSDDAMRAACQTALDITEAQRAAIFLLESDAKSQARLARSIGLTDAHLETYVSMPHRSRQPDKGVYVVPDVSKTGDSELIELARKGEFSAFAEVALRSGNNPTGFLVVYHNEPHEYRKPELDLLETLAYQITAALDNAALLKALELYASEQAQLVHLSRISTASMELEEVIEGISGILCQMMNVSRADIGLFVPGKDRVHFYGAPDADVHTLALSDVPELEQISQESAPLLRVFHRDERTLSQPLTEIMERHDEATVVIIPMITNNRSIGVIVLGSREPRAFSEGEWRLLEMASNQVAAQIHNAQQFKSTEEALKRRLEQLSLIERIAQQISAALDFDELIANVLEAAMRATQADMAELALLTDDGQCRIIGQELIDGEWYQYQATQSKDEGVIGRVVETGQTMLVADNSQSPYYTSSFSEGTYRSSLAVPLIKEGTVIGVLNMESVQHDFFTEEKASFINNLAGHAMISIENARLLEERQYQIETLTSLRQLSLRLAGSATTNRQTVARAVLKTALSMLQGSEAALYYYNPTSNELSLLGSMRYEEGRYIIGRTLIPNSIIYRAAHEGETIIIEKVRESETYQQYTKLDRIDYASLLVIPIKRAKRVREILCVMFPRQRHFGERDLNTLELLTIQVASHLENIALLERIRASGNRMRAILDSTRDGVILLDRSGNLMDANPSAEKLLGISLEDHMGENFAMMLIGHADTETSNALTDIGRFLRLEPERISRRQFELRVKGQQVYVEEVGSPVMDAHNRIIGRLLVFRDITEEKLLAAYRDEITNMAVHDLRSPLSTIISSLTLSQEIIQDISDDTGALATIGEVIQVSLDSGAQLMQLVDSLLDIAKLERREMPLKRAPVPVGQMVDGAFTTLQTTIQTADVHFEAVIPEGLPEVYVDADKIRRVLINLLDNAIRFTPTGGQIQISAALMRTQQDHVIIRVADSGRGIPPEERERVFEKYRQIKGNTPARGRKGTGLGLTFCKVAVEAHGERIWVEPEGPLPGACFAFTLPVATDSIIASLEAMPTTTQQ